ncbi:MAG: hypothetical protein ACREQV_14770, partial [Candidatus Binatia bacterium]
TQSLVERGGAGTPRSAQASAEHHSEPNGSLGRGWTAIRSRIAVWGAGQPFGAESWSAWPPHGQSDDHPAGRTEQLADGLENASDYSKSLP